MSSKRDLKKEIRRVCSDLALNCIFARDYVADIDKAAMNEMIVRIAKLQRTTLRHVSISFEKVPDNFESEAEFRKVSHSYFTKAYRTLMNEFNNSVAEIVKGMNALLPAKQREINKKALSKL